MKYALIYIQFDIEYPAGSPLTQSSQNLLKKKPHHYYKCNFVILLYHNLKIKKKMAIMFSRKIQFKNNPSCSSGP